MQKNVKEGVAWRASGSDALGVRKYSGAGIF